MTANKSLHVCQVVSSSGTGGLEKHVVELCSELAKQHRVTLVCPDSLEFPQAQAQGVEIINVNFRLSRRNPLLAWQLFRTLRASGCDVIHTHANKASRILGNLKRWLPQPLVATLHNQRLPRSRNFRQADAVIAVSQQAAATLDGWNNVRVVYNGSVHQCAEPLSKAELCKAYALDPDKPLLCSVGRYVDAKGYDLLLEAMSTVDANLLLVGDGALREPLQKQLAANGLSERVILTGIRDDVPCLLPAVDGMVISSRSEGFPYVFVEALLAGVRIVSTRVSTSEFLPESLTMDTTPEAMSAKLNQVLSDEAAWSAQMQPVWARAAQELTLQNMAQQTSDVYFSALKSSS